MSGLAPRLAVPAVLVAMAAGSIPNTRLSHAFDRVGLSQPWGVFAPHPASEQMALSADVVFGDGGHATWHPPRRGVLLAALGYHWEMWITTVVRDPDSPLWPSAARWIASHGGWGTRRVVRVTLRRTWTELPPPGSGGPRPIPNEFDFYTLNLVSGQGR